MQHTARQTKVGLLVIAAPLLIAVGGFAILYLLITNSMPVENGWQTGILYFFIIMLALSVPYLMLKISSHGAHLSNPNEKEFELKDVPKDKHDMERDMPDRKRVG